MRALVIIAILASACVEQGPGPQPKKIDPAYVQTHLLAAPPADLTKFDVAVGEGIAIYLGNKIDKSKAAPGGQITITHYWKALRSPGPTWKVFTLVRGPAGTADFMNLPATDMQVAHGPATWEPGEIIEDVQTITLRPDWRSTEATVLVGLIEQGRHGTLDRMNVVGPNTRDRAIVAGVLEVDLSRAPPPKGTAHLVRAQGAINIDGVAAEAGWLGVPFVELVTAEGSVEPAGKASVKLTWDDQFLYLFATIVDTDIVSPFKKHDDPLWEGDCIEIFIDADNTGKGYVELQANPLGITFDAWFPTTRPNTDKAWDSGMVAVAKLRGSVEAGDSGDQSWDVEIGIPWAAVKGKNPEMKVELPPRIGDRWRLNVVRVDRKTGKPKEVAASSWNRITMQDFHALDRMLNVVFADPTGAIVKQAQPALAPTQAGFTTVTLIGEVEPGTVTVELLDAGGQKIDGKQVPDSDLLSTLAARGPDPQLAVSAGANVMQTRATTLFERARHAGVSKIALVTAIDLGLVEQNPVPATTPIAHGIAMPVGTLELIAVPAGGTKIGDKVLTDADVDRVLAAIAARDKQLQIVVRPEGNVRYSRVLAAIELARIAGFQKLAIGAPVTLIPAAADAALAQIKDRLELELTNAAAMFANVPLDDAQAAALLRAAFARTKDLEIVVIADGAVAHMRVAWAFDLARQAGFTKLSLAAKKAMPASPIEAIDASPNAIVVELPVAGGIKIANKPVTEAELDATLAARFKQDKTAVVIVRAERGVMHARVVAVIDRAKQVGLTRIGIAKQ